MFYSHNHRSNADVYAADLYRDLISDAYAALLLFIGEKRTAFESSET